MATFYSNFLKSYEDFYKFDFVSGTPFQVTAKSNKKEENGKKHSFEQKLTFDNTEEGNGLKLGSELKVKASCEKSKFEAKITPNKVKIEKTCTPPQVNNDTTEGSFMGRLEYKAGDETPDLTAGFTYGLPKLNDDVSVYFEGNVTYKGLKDLKGEFTTLSSYQNKFFIGSEVIGDLKTQKPSSIHGVAAADLDGSFVYMKHDCINHLAKLGFSTKKLDQFDTFAAETQVAVKQEGPLQDRTTTTVAFSKALSDDFTLKGKFDITKKVHAEISWIHKINDNFKITFSDRLNPVGIFTEPAKEKYELGIAFEGIF